MRKVYYILTVLTVLLLTSCGRNAVVYEYAIVPEPVYLNQQEGSFTFTKSTKIFFENMGQNAPTSEYILKSLRKMRVRPSLAGKAVDNCIVFSINPADSQNTELGEEGYLLEVRPNGVYVSANTETGLFYGFQTLVQIFPEDMSKVRYSKITVPLCTVLDYPRFSWRGSLRDVSRHFFSVGDIKKHLDLMAAYKLNKFHWHLTDDHGWRIQIERYPELTDIGAWRVDRDSSEWMNPRPAQPGEARTYGGYYTKDDIREVVAYAARLHIDVIPEIEIPGHSCAILEAYPQLGCQGDDTTYQTQYGSYWPPRAILCGGSDSVMQFLCNVLDEVCELFPYEYIHIGGDEAVKYNWERCPLCQSRIRQLRLEGEEGLQGWMMQQVEQYLATKGKRVIGWDEMLDGSVSPNATVMVWRNAGEEVVGQTMSTHQRVALAAQQGNPVIMTPLDYCYHNFYQANPDYSPVSQPNQVGFISLRRAYQYDPTVGLTPQQARVVIGGQSNLWAEFIPNTKNAEIKLLPRMLACAECLWTPTERKDWPRFRTKVERQKQRLAALGYAYGESSFKPELTVTHPEKNLCRVELDWCQEGTEIYFTLDGSEPTTSSPHYVSPFTCQRGTTLRTASYYQGELKEEVYTFEIK